MICSILVARPICAPPHAQTAHRKPKHEAKLPYNLGITLSVQCVSLAHTQGLIPIVGGSRERGTSMLIEDVACPVEKLGDMMIDLIEMFKVGSWSWVGACIYRSAGIHAVQLHSVTVTVAEQAVLLFIEQVNT